MATYEEKMEKAKRAMLSEAQRLCEEYGLRPDQILALMAYTTGAAIAYQDQRTMTHEMVWDLVLTNIRVGNEAAVAQLSSAGGTMQ